MTWGILVPQPGIEACSFNHWATRGVLGSIILDLKKRKSSFIDLYRIFKVKGVRNSVRKVPGHPLCAERELHLIGSAHYSSLLERSSGGNPLVILWLGLGAFSAVAQVPFLVGELRSCKLCSVAKTETNVI